MSTQQIKNLLAQLQDELQKTELDDETRGLVRALDADVNDLLSEETESADASSIVSRAKELEANFATDHPTAERFMREVIDTLVRMGI